MAINLKKNDKQQVKPIPAVDQPISINSSKKGLYARNRTTGELVPLGKPVFRNRKNHLLAGKWSLYGLAILVIIALVGHTFLYLTTPKPPTKEEIQSYAREAVGVTGYNKEAGAEIATGYVKAYLSLKTDETAEKQLAMYLTGDALSSSDLNLGSANIRSYTSNAAQQVVGTPQVTRITMHKNPALATYRVTALVKPSATGTGTSIKDASKNNANQASELKQITMAVTVAFNESNSTYYIATPHPAILPSPIMGKSSTLIPSTSVTGTKIQNTADTDSVINGFFKAYVTATPEKRGDLAQYVLDTKTLTLANAGLGGKFTINTNDISYELYRQEDGTLIAKVNLTLVDELGGSTDSDTSESTKQSITYPVTYQVTLAKQNNGKYLVTDLMPDTYNANTTELVSN
jgi:hypothetical protein